MGIIKKIISVTALFVFNLAIMTPYGGFTKWITYEPEVPERLKNRREMLCRWGDKV